MSQPSNRSPASSLEAASTFPQLEVDAKQLLEAVRHQQCEVSTEHRFEGLRFVISYPRSGDMYPGPLFDPGCKIIRSLQEIPMLSTRVSTFKPFFEVWNSDAEFRKELLATKDSANFGKYALRKKYGYNIPATFIPCVARTLYDTFGKLLLVNRDEGSVGSSDVTTVKTAMKFAASTSAATSIGHDRGTDRSDSRRRGLRVLDPCAGWGDRMLGAMCSDAVEEYVGVDCNPSVFAGYEAVKNIFENDENVCSNCGTKVRRRPIVTSTMEEEQSSSAVLVDCNCHGAGAKVRMIKKRIEECGEEVLPSNYFDVVFTSPPFFDYEVYSSANPTYKDWDQEFYLPLVRVSRRVLRTGGIIAFHIDDTSAGKTPRSIRENSTECWGVSIGFGKRIARIWILDKAEKANEDCLADRAQRGHGRAGRKYAPSVSGTVGKRPRSPVTKTPSQIRFVVLMGVSGCGKSTIGKLVAERLGWKFYDADDFHSEESLAKMTSGSPLDDADCAPWLHALHALISQALAEMQPGVLACSALKRKYRETLLAGCSDDNVQLVYLKGAFSEIQSRVEAHSDHFMTPSMLHSQFEALEEPTGALIVDITESPLEIADRILAAVSTGL